MLKFMILHDAPKTIQNWVSVLFLKKEQKPVLKKIGLKKLVGCLFFFNGFFSTLIVFQSFL